MTRARTVLHENAGSQDTLGVLTPSQIAAVALLAAGKSYADVAQAVGVDASTLYRWRRESAFSHELQAHEEPADEMSAHELHARVRRLVFGELAGRADADVLAIVHTALSGEQP